jgi:integrase
MRLGELLGLKWGDIDWNAKFIRVERSYQRGHLDKAKTGRTRKVDISDQLEAALKELLAVRKREAIKAGSPAPLRFVFQGDGEPNKKAVTH